MTERAMASESKRIEDLPNIEQQLEKIDATYRMKGFDMEEEDYEPITSQLEFRIKQINQILDKDIEQAKPNRLLDYDKSIIAIGEEAENRFYQIDWFTEEYW